MNLLPLNDSVVAWFVEFVALGLGFGLRKGLLRLKAAPTRGLARTLYVLFDILVSFCDIFSVGFLFLPLYISGL